MMNLDTRTRSKLAWAASLLAPVIAVQTVQLLVGGSASPAPAAAAIPAAPPPPAASEPERALTPAQIQARNWLGSRHHALHARSPMDRPDPAPPEAPAPSPAPAGTPAPPIPAPEPPSPVEGRPKGLVLTGMIAGGTQSPGLASINHRVYRVGEMVSGGWRVSQIDTRKRIVTLTNWDGREMLLEPITASQER